MASKSLGKKVFLTFIIPPLVLVGLLLIFIAWAVRPGLDEIEFPKQGILSLPEKTLEAKTDPSTLTVVSYNIGYASGDKNNQGAVLAVREVEENLKAMVESLGQLQPDLLFLQEVDFFAKRTFDINQMENIAQALGLPHAAYVVTWNKKYIAWPYWPPKHHFGHTVSGQVVLSRYPLSDQKIETFPKPEDNPPWYNWFYVDRVIQSMVVQVGDPPLQIINVHLEAFSEEHKEKQIKGLAQAVRGLGPGPKIVAGDFNLIWSGKGKASEDPKAHRALLEDFQKDTQMKLTSQDNPQFTFNSWQPHKQIDLIFYSPDLSLQGEGVLKDLPASDHLPVWARLQRGD